MGKHRQKSGPSLAKQRTIATTVPLLSGQQNPVTCNGTCSHQGMPALAGEAAKDHPSSYLVVLDISLPAKQRYLLENDVPPINEITPTHNVEHPACRQTCKRSSGSILGLFPAHGQGSGRNSSPALAAGGSAIKARISTGHRRRPPFQGHADPSLTTSSSQH